MHTSYTKKFRKHYIVNKFAAPFVKHDTGKLRTKAFPILKPSNWLFLC